MVCEKCQLKLKRVITPDVVRRPICKAGSVVEEKPDEKVPLYKRKGLNSSSSNLMSETIDFSSISTK